MQPDDKYYSELDLRLQQLALTDWPTFVKLIGEEHIESAKVLVLRKKGLSLMQIANKLGLTESKVRYKCEKRADIMPKKKENTIQINKVA